MLNYFLRVIRTLKHYSDIVSDIYYDILSGVLFGIYS